MMETHLDRSLNKKMNRFSNTNNNYTLIHADNYCDALKALGIVCNQTNNAKHPTFTFPEGGKFFRPLTFKETIEARLNNFFKERRFRSSPKYMEDSEKLRLFNSHLDTSTGVVYSLDEFDNYRMKIVPFCSKFLEFEDIYSGAIKVDYNIIQGIELKLNPKSDLFNRTLTKDEVLNHEAWRVAVEEDMTLLRAYIDLVYTDKHSDYFGDLPKMGFFNLPIPNDHDTLVALGLSSFSSNVKRLCADAQETLNQGTKFILLE